MIRLSKPSRSEIERFLKVQRQLPFSYPHVGATRGEPPRGYAVDRNQVLLGRGPETFHRAKEAITRWEMFQIPWIELCWADTPVAVGSTVAILVRIAGLWRANACRIVYLLDEEDATRRFGFGYGTLPAHAERGEERFSVEWRSEDDSVWYQLFAFSRPHGMGVRAAYPFVRRIQKRFARDSMRAMLRAVAEAGR
jgi:uncharacterized protein (UPF0548 family)